MTTMFKPIIKSIVKLICVLLIPFWMLGCETPPGGNPLEIDNVLTEKQKKELMDSVRPFMDAIKEAERKKGQT